MKIQCDACESSVAVLICCADEAALCLDCDRRVHAANKLAIKHQRVPLIPAPSKLPRCDICQEKPALIFCLEDRALLCRNCDVSIHSSNTLASGHQRFLATGIRIALNAACPVETAIAEETPKDPHSQSSGITFKGSLKGVSGVSSGINAMTLPRVGGFVEATKALNIATAENEAIFAGSTKLNDVAESPPGEGAIWQIDDVLSSPAFAVGYGIGDIVSSKADIPNIGDYHWMADMTVFDEQVYSESPGEVPQVPCYPTATEWSRPGKLNTALKGKMKYDMVPAAEIDDTFMVPDLGHLSEQLPLPPNKRRRSLLEV